MIRLSEIISKQVICLEEAEIVGTVSNVLFDATFNKVRYLEVYSEDFADSSKYLPVNKLCHSDGDAVVIRTRTSLLDLCDITDLGSPSPINSQCFSYDGAYLGSVNDILFTAQKVDSVLIKKSDSVLTLSFPETADLSIMTLVPKNILSFSENIIIANNPEKPIKLPKHSSPFVSRTNPPVEIHSLIDFAKPVQFNTPQKEQKVEKDKDQVEKTPFDTLIKTETEQKAKTQVFTASANLMPQIPPAPPADPVPLVLPKKVGTENAGGRKADISKYDFLLGKKITVPILDEGETFINEGETVTRETIERAIQKSKLIQIALHAE